MEPSPVNRPALRRLCLALAMAVSLVPFAGGLSGSKIFYIRDLSTYFWGRYLWLRHAWLGGEFPLWDPYVGNGQAAHSDAMHQMFLPPSILVRLVGSDVVGFNLWVAAPFPLAAMGAWLFLSRRVSTWAATLGAIAFAVCGPTISSGNMPNLSWSVAALPWVLWAIDRLVNAPDRRNLALLAVVAATQVLCGEPVTLFTTMVLTLAYAVCVGEAAGRATLAERLRVSVSVVAGMALGAALAAVQLIPMLVAARLADRDGNINPDIWSLRPTALVETLWLHFFGNYYTAASLADVPWLALVFTGREPLLFSLYFGIPLLALAVCGLAGDGPRRWRLFWLVAGLVSVLAAFGSYTPVYPVLRDHVPPFGTFRFPVKYLYAAVMAVAAASASGWDTMAHWWSQTTDHDATRRRARARTVALLFALTMAGATAAFAAMCAYFPERIGGVLTAYAHALGAEKDTATAFMLRSAPGAAAPIVATAALTALAVFAATSSALVRLYRPALAILSLLIVGDLLVRGAGINPVMDVKWFAQPQWLSAARSNDASIYVGGKNEGTLEGMDSDASRFYVAEPALTPSGSRAALNVTTAYYPSGWGVREILSYDLPKIWPRLFTTTAKRFFESARGERERFLRRTGARYRVLPQRRAGGRAPLMPLPQFYESFLFDFADAYTPRASVVPEAQLVADPQAQIDALFESDWDEARVVLVDRELPLAGTPGRATEPSARVTLQASNRTTIDASAGAGGGYLVLLDSFADDWTATVDGRSAPIARANGLFRAIHLAEGSHHVAFAFHPRSLHWGVTVTSVAALSLLALLVWPRRQAEELAGESARAA